MSKRAADTLRVVPTSWTEAPHIAPEIRVSTQAQLWLQGLAWVHASTLLLLGSLGVRGLAFSFDFSTLSERVDARADIAVLTRMAGAMWDHSANSGECRGSKTGNYL